MEIVEYLNKIFNFCSNDIKERNIINRVLSKLNMNTTNYKLIKENNKIFIKYHTFFINIYKNFINEELIFETLQYKQPLIFSKNSKIPICQNYYQIINNENFEDLYICITYNDIIIDLETNRYTIIKTNFNIRKPSNDIFKLFEKIINNINNPLYYFIVNYDLNSINTSYSDIKNNIYDLNDIRISFNNNNKKHKINFDIIMPTSNTISTNIDTKPLISNQIKRIIINNNIFI